MNLCQVVSTVTPLPSFLPPSSRVLRVIQPLRSIPCPFPPFARFFPLFYYFLDNLSLSLLAPSRLESTLLPVERLSGRKVNSMVFGKGRSERINPVSRFYDFLKKKSQEVYTVFLPPPSLAHVGHSVQILDFLRFLPFFSFPSSVPEIQVPTVLPYRFLGLLAIDLYLANHSGTRCPFRRSAYFFRNGGAEWRIELISSRTFQKG